MWMQTRSGLKFDLLDIDVNKINIGDIAHALSMQCRFNGHTRQFYSVAEHCCHVLALMPRSMPVPGRMSALMHDAPEAYIGDMISPIKDGMPAFRDLEDRLMRAIERRFNFAATPQEHAALKRADLYMTKVEGLALLENPAMVAEWDLTAGIDTGLRTCPELFCSDPPQAKRMFLSAFHRLVEEHRSTRDLGQ